MLLLPAPPGPASALPVSASPVASVPLAPSAGAPLPPDAPGYQPRPRPRPPRPCGTPASAAARDPLPPLWLRPPRPPRPPLPPPSSPPPLPPLPPLPPPPSLSSGRPFLSLYFNCIPFPEGQVNNARHNIGYHLNQTRVHSVIDIQVFSKITLRSECPSISP
jgi:hypothetical protein